MSFEVASAGGSGASGAKADAFIQLGDLLHKNFNQSTSIIGQLIQEKKRREQEQKQFQEQMRLRNKEFGLQQEQMGLQRQDRAMTGLDFLTRNNDVAMTRFKNLLYR